MLNSHMTWPFALIAVLTVAGAVAAMSLRNLVHCALMLMVALAGVAALYLQLGAEFVGFAQFLIYIGAVAILIVFAILLTRGSEPPGQSIFSPKWVVGVGIAVAVFGLLSGVVLSSRVLTREIRPPPEATVHQIGDQLMGKYILPLEVIGLLLTAALIGAVLIAMHEKEGDSA
jgi:NADH:ubiquinone oxidoreductase subunit 6 (subunit J)